MSHKGYDSSQGKRVFHVKREGVLAAGIPIFRNDTYVIERLNRWCVYMHWLTRSGDFTWPGPNRVRSWWALLVLDPNMGEVGKVSLARSAVACPVDQVEAQQTTRCVRALSVDLREVVIERYLHGGTIEQQVDAIGCCLDTYYRRLNVAHFDLLGLFNDVEAGVPLPGS